MIEYLKSQKFRQRIELLELTKQLEREPCDSLSFTHRLQKNLFPYSFLKTPNVLALHTNFSGETISTDPNNAEYFHWDSTIANNLIVTPTATNVTNNIPYQRLGVFGGSWGYDVYVTIKDPSQNYLISSKRIYGENGNDGDDYSGKKGYFYENGKYVEATFFASSPGVYTIEYETTKTYGGQNYLKLTYPIEARSAQIDTKPIPSITDVINRILDVGLPRMAYQTPKYHLDPVIAEKMASVPSPEFFLPRMTLFEALLTVGHYIHAIPRLVFNETTQKADTITYDFLGLDEEYTFPSSSCIVGYKNIQNGDDYCGALDDYAENVVNTIDPGAGSITEQWKTLRTASGQAIDNDTAVIETEKPIYRIIKVEMGYTDKSTNAIVGDITQFVYEQAEYEGLFVSDGATYPNSVAYALCYQQGTRYIKGFNTTSSSLLNLIQNFNKPAIVNIAKLKRDGSIGTSQLYGNLAFRVTYIPMDNLRIRQYKPYTGYPNDNILYNQQNANTVEANYYGENLKGKIARLGNEIQVYTVRFKHASELPRVGMILADDEKKPYVYKITTKRARNFITADIYCTQDFNRLSEYFGLNSNFRLYEVSERQSIDRQVIVPRIIRVSFNNALSTQNDFPFITANGARRFMDTFLQRMQLAKGDFGKNAKVAAMQLCDDEGVKIGDYCYAKAVNSVALGNSLSFSWAFEDNFSAGNRSVPSGSYQWKQQKTSPYGGVYGNFYLLDFAIGANIYRNGSVFKLAYDDQKNGFCDALPTIKEGMFESTRTNSFFRTIDLSASGYLDTRVVVDKNSSEKISVSAQLHGQADDKRIVLGSAMWTNNGLIRENFSGNAPKWYGFQTKINMLRSFADISQAEVLRVSPREFVDVGVEFPYETTTTVIPVGKLRLPSIPNGKSYKSIALCDSVTGQMYIGVNAPFPENINQGAYIYFNFDLNP